MFAFEGCDRLPTKYPAQKLYNRVFKAIVDSPKLLILSYPAD